MLTDLARQCHGMPSIILLLAEALPNVPRTAWNPVEALSGYIVDLPVSFVSADLAPPVPPPQAARFDSLICVLPMALRRSRRSPSHAPDFERGETRQLCGVLVAHSRLYAAV